MDGRKIGIVGIGFSGSWPEWLEGMTAGDVAGEWRVKQPLWLLECLPNLPAAQLAVEIGAKGPVETLRPRPSAGEEARQRVQRWLARGIERVLIVEATAGGAKAVVWCAEEKI